MMDSFLGRLVARETLGIDVLRLILCAILFAHGAFRFYDGTIPKLGEILSANGLPAGVFLANLVNLAETGGTGLVAVRLMVLPISLVLSFIYIVGIVLFHRHEGFFVVGPGSGGWEYSALIITCLLVIAWENRAHKFV
jgi:putative oxidoreductase